MAQAQVLIDFHSQRMRNRIMERQLHAIINYTAAASFDPAFFVDTFEKIGIGVKNVLTGVGLGLEHVIGGVSSGVGDLLSNLLSGPLQYFINIAVFVVSAFLLIYFLGPLIWKFFCWVVEKICIKFGCKKVKDSDSKKEGEKDEKKPEKSDSGHDQSRLKGQSVEESPVKRLQESTPLSSVQSMRRKLFKRPGEAQVEVAETSL